MCGATVYPGSNVIESGYRRTPPVWNTVRFFVLRKLVIGGREMSLYSYENDVIRNVGDPRVHFALNCSAVSCPILPRRPFAAGDLQATLDRETRRFFASPANLRIDRAGKTVHVSEILSFYRDDFTGGGRSLIAFINEYAPQPVPEDFDLRFIPYDWTIANSRLAAA